MYLKNVMQFRIYKETVIYLLLVVLTLSSWYVANNEKPVGLFGLNERVVIILFAAFKVRLVLRYFMEVNQAASVLKILTDAWLFLISLSMCFFLL